MACRGACDGSQASKGLANVVLGNISLELVFGQLDLGANCANPAGIGINDTASNSNALWQAELRGGQTAERAYALASAGKLSALELMMVS